MRVREQILADELELALAKYRAAKKATMGALKDLKGQIEGEYQCQRAVRLETIACEAYCKALIRWNAHVRQQLERGISFAPP